MKLLHFFGLALLVAAPSIRAATIPYSNDFSGSGSNTAFPAESTDAEWTVSGGVYQFSYSNTTITPSTASLPLTNVANQSFVMQTDLTVSSTGSINSNGATLGLAAFGATTSFAGTAASSSYYLADWQVANTASPGNLRILALGDATGFTNTPVTVDADPTSSTLAAALGTTYTLKLTGTFTGGTLNLTLGVFDSLGNQIGTSATATDTSPLTGTNFGYRNRIGLGGGTFSAGFDNFSVTATAIPEPTAVGFAATTLASALLARRRRAAM